MSINNRLINGHLPSFGNECGYCDMPSRSWRDSTCLGPASISVWAGEMEFGALMQAEADEQFIDDRPGAGIPFIEDSFQPAPDFAGANSGEGVHTICPSQDGTTTARAPAKSSDLDQEESSSQFPKAITAVTAADIAREKCSHTPLSKNPELWAAAEARAARLAQAEQHRELLQQLAKSSEQNQQLLVALLSATSGGSIDDDSGGADDHSSSSRYDESGAAPETERGTTYVEIIEATIDAACAADYAYYEGAAEEDWQTLHMATKRADRLEMQAAIVGALDYLKKVGADKLKSSATSASTQAQQAERRGRRLERAAITELARTELCSYEQDDWDRGLNVGIESVLAKLKNREAND